MSQKIFIALCLFDVIQSIVHLLPSIVYRWPLFVSLLVHAISSFKQVFTNLAAQKMFLSYPFVFLFCKISIKPSFLWHSRDCVIIWISLTFLRSGALHWLSDWPKNFFAVGSSYQSSLTPWSSKNFLRSGALMRTHWLPHRPTNSLRSGALIRAYWVPDRATNFFWLGALIWAHWLPDWTTNLFAIVNPHQSSVTQVMINNLLAIGSSYWSPLTPALLNKPCFL